MPSNYTIAKALGRISYYKQLCGTDPHHFAEGAMLAQGLAGARLDDIHANNPARLKEIFNEADDEFFQALAEIIAGKEDLTALQGGEIPLSLLDVTEIKGLGAKSVRRLYTELGVTDLPSLKAKVDDGSLVKLKGFGPSTVEKINAHLAALEKKKEKAEKKKK
ncbi:hypothetical protein DB346_24145 [Verrucomicrobia bacterium LW23]|nr:hypothetical protein DB346_24145 [Verrucomicrobia bacterium LW23]